jgi:acyl-CoA synthetase (AMP-forming)/AMP-acid ligase II
MRTGRSTASAQIEPAGYGRKPCVMCTSTSSGILSRGQITMSTILTLVEKWAGEKGGEPFLIGPETADTVNFGQLREYSRVIDRYLSAGGIGRGEKVAFLMENGLWSAILFLGVMASGRVIVPLNAVSGDDQLRYVLDHSDSQLLFVTDTYRDRAQTIMRGIERPVTPIPTHMERGPSWPWDPGTPAAELRPEAEDIALLIYTSGTTGLPKGVLLSHRGVIAGGRYTVEAHALTERDRALCVLPLYHINGEIVTVIAPLLSGGSLVIPYRYSTSAFWKWIERYRCTWFSVVPTIIAYVLDKAGETADQVRNGEGFRQVRFGRSASSALSPEMHKAFENSFGIRMVETMGLTETAAQILSNPLPPATGKYGSPGIPYGNEVRVVDDEGNELPRGRVGELVVRGDNVMSGYYKNPEATASALRDDGWFCTGDLGYQDEDDYFFITGRIKELIIKGGENVAPREIDEVLLQHPGVLEAAAFAVPDERYGQEIMACVVPSEGVELEGESLREYCVSKLGRFKAPREVTVVRWLPKGPSGKVQRLKVPELLEDMRTTAPPASSNMSRD